ncbi:MAG TPA: Gfo/Idh/MocA family oxidoreductase, partial [Gemmatimonadaceae bacterium]|nr:Gfo/Idh/MocA family oxidoreductase [Gemmatimonadaceae bacterium]
MSKHSRRDFVKTASVAALGAMVVPRRVLGLGGLPPSRTLNIALVGVGGRGLEVMTRFLDENIVAVCDVDYAYVERSLDGRLRPRSGNPPTETNVKLGEAYRKAEKFTDFRRMLERRRDIDAVMIATPDHTHAHIAMAAMQLGKHVYVEKPLAYSVYENRLLARTARSAGIVSQMGHQGHSEEGTRRIRDLVTAGVIGPVREVHIWTDRPVRFWAQGLPRPGWDNTPPPPANPPAVPPRPEDANVHPRWSMRTVETAVLKEMASQPQTQPPGLEWDLFLGPAKALPYHPSYHPFSWRGWIDFGVGALGDMGAHLVDQAYFALDLDQPASIVASSTPWGGPASDPASYPLAMSCQYEFAARGARPAVKVLWYDGGLLPPRPAHFPDDQALPIGAGGGAYFVGDRGILVHEVYGRNPKVYPESLAAEAEAVPKTT